jgi:nitrite reductase/ring-hydroxylating ferredoxin subunit
MRINQFRERFFLFAVLLVFTLFSCDKREEYIPYVYVDFTVYLNIHNDLTTPGYSFLFPNVGYGGVIIMCESYDYTAPANSIFHAFDATCTNEVSDSCTVINEGNSFYAECPCCHSKYELLTGNPIEGAALYALKTYKVTIMGDQIHVSNY